MLGFICLICSKSEGRTLVPNKPKLAGMCMSFVVVVDVVLHLTL